MREGGKWEDQRNKSQRELAFICAQSSFHSDLLPSSLPYPLASSSLQFPVSPGLISSFICSAFLLPCLPNLGPIYCFSPLTFSGLETLSFELTLKTTSRLSRITSQTLLPSLSDHNQKNP